MKPAIRISLFGKFSVHMWDEVILDHAPHKAQELLAYLTLHAGRAHPRETLAELLWGEQDTPNSRKYLRQALWQLHSGLVALGRTRAAQLLHAESEWLELSLDDRVDVDVVQFEEALAAVNGGRGEDLRPEQARTLAETARLYRGDLLEGWVAEWCRYDRERFRRMFLTVLDNLTDYHDSRQGHEAAIAYATLSLQFDGARERSHRSLMRALAKSGDRSGAIRQYSRCVEALREELGVAPEPETVELEQLIRAGQVAGAVRERFPEIGSGVPVGNLAIVAASRRTQAGRARQT